MAITAVAQFNSSPLSTSDYQAQNAHIQAFINNANGSIGVLAQESISTIPSIKQGAYIQFGGTLYIVDTSDYTILGSASSGINYIALAVSGSNLTATWVQTITSYTWNSVYNYYTDGTNVLLPYAVNLSGSDYYISRYDQMFDQGLKTTSNVTFASVNTGHGDNEVYKITFQTEYSSSSSDYSDTVDSMDIGEIRLFSGTVVNTNASADIFYSIYLPSGGTYQVTASGASSFYPSSPTAYSSRNAIFAGVFSGGSIIAKTIIFDASPDLASTLGLVVRRIS